MTRHHGSARATPAPVTQRHHDGPLRGAPSTTGPLDDGVSSGIVDNFLRRSLIF
jgi:hypothetical protein